MNRSLNYSYVWIVKRYSRYLNVDSYNRSQTHTADYFPWELQNIMLLLLDSRLNWNWTASSDCKQMLSL